MLETAKERPAVRRPPIGNAIMRLIGCALALPFLNYAAELLPLLEQGRAAQLVDAHILFNCLLAALFLPLVGTVAHGSSSVCGPTSRRPRIPPR